MPIIIYELKEFAIYCAALGAAVLVVAIGAMGWDGFLSWIAWVFQQIAR